MVSTVTSVGRKTGVESGLRRYLDSRRPSDVERQGEQSKRTRLVAYDDEMDVDPRSDSAIHDSEVHEYLPAYPTSKPPSYREAASPDRPQMTRPPNNRSWSTQLMISTSGLGVALNESSLRSLTYCVGLLTKATEHVETAMNALKSLLHELDQSQEASKQDNLRHAKEIEAGVISRSQAERDAAAEKLAERIKQICDDIWNTMKTVVDSVSTYAGGALPDNARALVKSQLLSIPQRWRFASESAQQQDQNAAATGIDTQTNAQGEARKAAHRMIAFAEEGLDMMTQVNGVVKITLQSAEDWLRSFGRSNRSRQDQIMDNDGSRDVRMAE